MFGVRRLQMLLLVVRSVFSLSGILSLGVKFHRYWIKLTCLFPRFLLFPLGIFMLLNRSVRLESFKIMESVSIPTLSVPMSTSIPDEDVSCVQFDAALSEVQLSELKAVFQGHADILTTRPGVFSGNLMLEIPLRSDVPIRRKMYNLPFSSEEVVEKEIQVMLDLEIIEPSKSPYSSSVVLVRKKDGSCTFCIDFRGLNKITVFDVEPIPNSVLRFCQSLVRRMCSLTFCLGLQLIR